MLYTEAQGSLIQQSTVQYISTVQYSVVCIVQNQQTSDLGPCCQQAASGCSYRDIEQSENSWVTSRLKAMVFFVFICVVEKISLSRSIIKLNHKSQKNLRILFGMLVFLAPPDYTIRKKRPFYKLGLPAGIRMCSSVYTRFPKTNKLLVQKLQPKLGHIS